MPTVINGPHVLFVGKNGKRTAGITVRSDSSLEECKASAHQYEWDVNTYSLSRAEPNRYNLTTSELTMIVAKCTYIEGEKG
jgi:hypothetical protein